MSREPRDPGLAAIFRATVRVADGSGVVIRNGQTALVATAAHVVKGGDVHTVRRDGVFGECSVIVCDDDLDLALLVPPADLEAVALAVVAKDADTLPGDLIWAAGFPRGWKGPDPLIAPGTIAGVGEDNWVNLDGTWGNSGGPVCRVGAPAPVVAGILLGKAGKPSAELEDFIERVDGSVAFLEAVKELRDGPVRRGEVFDTSSDTFDELENLALQASGIVDIAELLDGHFRTGFLRFAPASDLRKLLG